MGLRGSGKPGPSPAPAPHPEQPVCPGGEDQPAPPCPGDTARPGGWRPCSRREERVSVVSLLSEWEGSKAPAPCQSGDCRVGCPRPGGAGGWRATQRLNWGPPAEIRRHQGSPCPRVCSQVGAGTVRPSCSVQRVTPRDEGQWGSLSRWGWGVGPHPRPEDASALTGKALHPPGEHRSHFTPGGCHSPA